MERNATTHNGDSNKDIVSGTELKEMMEKTTPMRMIIGTNKDITKQCVAEVDITAIEVVPASQRGEEGYKSTDQKKDPLKVHEAVATAREEGTIVVMQNGQIMIPEEQKENSALKASREKIELEQAAEEKYEQNSQTETR